MEDYVNGYVERTNDGKYTGCVTIEGIRLAPIEGVYFQKDNSTYLWLKRKRVLEYDDSTMSYSEREASPRWEAYMKKQAADNVVAYKGEFSFMRFRFSITGVWDRVLGTDSQHRLNLYVERLPSSEQTIINGINERKRNGL